MNSVVYLVVSYFPTVTGPARVRVNGIYYSLEEAETRQSQMCGGTVTLNTMGSSVRGTNGCICWIKKLIMGHLNQCDIYTPDSYAIV